MSARPPPPPTGAGFRAACNCAALAQRCLPRPERSSPEPSPPERGAIRPPTPKPDIADSKVLWDVLYTVTWLDLCVDVLCCVGVALTVLGFVRMVSTGQWRLRLSTLARPWFGERDTSAVREKLLEFKVGQMRGLVRTSCLLLAPFTAFGPWLTPQLRVITLLLGTAQAVLAVLMMMPCLLTPRSLDAVFCILAALPVLGAAPFTTQDTTLLRTLVPANGLLVMLVVVRRTTRANLPVLLVVNLVFALAAASSIMLRGRLAFGDARLLFAGAQLLVGLLLTLAAPVLEGRFSAWMRQLLETKELKELLSASQSLLRTCFDVVVELDASGCVVSTGPELGALLLREGGRQGMQGADFAELIEDETARRRFREQLAGPTSKDLELAESMQASMKDACSNSLQLEMMWFGFTRLAGEGQERRYMLGLRETSDWPGLAAQCVPPAAPNAVAVVMPIDPASPAAGVSKVKVAVGDAGSVPETESVSSAQSSVDAAATIVVATTAGFPVVQVSASFRARVGHLRCGAPMASRVHRPQRMHIWLTDALRARKQPKDCRVTFNMPQGRVQARCRLLMDGVEDEAEEGDRVKLLFYGIQTERAVEGNKSALAHLGTVPSTSPATLGRPGTLEL